MHPGSHTALATEFLAYLSAMKSAKAASAYVAAHPDTPFSALLLARVPGLYLSAVKAKVAVQIEIGHQVFKGMLGH